LRFFGKLKNDETALKAQCTSRIEVVLRALGNAYLTEQLDKIDVNDTQIFQNGRGFGRYKLNKKLN